MTYFKRFSLLFFSVFSCVVFGQAPSSLHPPLAIPLQLSSNFGALRSNHFHMGLDFRTQQTTGFKLYSVDEGYVSRVKISNYGYGNVVYIDHPGGTTSVYAHCASFVGKIDSLVRVEQYRQKKVEIEFYPEKRQVPVQKGEHIAYSGNTGHSGGPHLHFELRDTKSEAALNPLLFGFLPADTRMPLIREVKIYPISQDAYVLNNRASSKKLTLSNGKYLMAGNRIAIPSSYVYEKGGLGLAFDVVDRMNATSFNYGIYRSELFVNDSLTFSVSFDKISFESSRFINAYKDYKDFHTSKKLYHRQFRADENTLEVYQKTSAAGVIKAEPGDSIKIDYHAYDFAGNKAVTSFWLYILPGPKSPGGLIIPGKDHLHPDSTFTYKSDRCELHLPKNCVYEPVKFTRSTLDQALLSPAVPVNQAYTLRLKKPMDYKGQYLIKISGEGMSPKTFLPENQGEWLTIETRYFGSYQLVVDTLAPKIKVITNYTDTLLSGIINYKWQVEDFESSIEAYDLYINGEWQVCTYEHKTKEILFSIPAELNGQLEIKLRVSDRCGNWSEWSKIHQRFALIEQKM